MQSFLIIFTIDIINFILYYKTMKTLFSKKLKAERKRIGWNQKVLCDRTGINYNTYVQWESGKTEPAPYFQNLVLKDLGGRGE